jgi:hypothetical protein
MPDHINTFHSASDKYIMPDPVIIIRHALYKSGYHQICFIPGPHIAGIFLHDLLKTNLDDKIDKKRKHFMNL